MLPRRATIEGFGFLVDQFRGWAGAGSLADPAGRARIWAELAPRVPKRDEERALVALALLRRAIPALVAIHRAPATDPGRAPRSGAPSTAPAGGASSCAGSTPSTRPGRSHEPRFGQVATIVVEPSTDRAENRFVAGVVRRLVALCREAATAPAWLDADQVRELTEATRALAGLAAEPPWAHLPSGGHAPDQLPAAGPPPLPGHADGGRRPRRQPPLEPPPRRPGRPRACGRRRSTPCSRCGCRRPCGPPSAAASA